MKSALFCYSTRKQKSLGKNIMSSASPMKISPVSPIKDREGFDWVKNIILTVDGETKVSYPMTRAASKLCCFFNAILDSTDEGDETDLPLQCNAPEVLPLIIGYCEYHKDSKPADLPMPLRQPIEYYLDVADRNFIDEFLVSRENPGENKRLMQVMADAHYLDCKPLVELCTAKIGSMIQGKTAQEIRTILHIEKADFGDRKFRTDEEIRAFSELRPDPPEGARK